MRVLGDKISSAGIGTYAEKSLHKILKLSLEPDESNHEIPHLGFVADIKNGQGITEIQTKAMKNLRDKLYAFLPDGRVLVVYPMYKNIRRHKITPDGEITEPRLSPKHQRIFDCAYELYNIRDFLADRNFKLCLMLLSVDEYVREGVQIKVAGKRRTKERIERIPFRIEEIIELNTPKDYLMLLPEGLPERFGAADINKACGKGFKRGFSIISILKSLDLLTEGERVGRTIKYSVKK